MNTDPNIDQARLAKWKENIIPNASAEKLKGKGSGASNCSGELTNEQFIELYNYVNDPKNGWINLGSNQQNPTKQERKASSDPNCSTTN